MSQPEPQQLQQTQQVQYEGDDDRRRYQRRQIKDRRQLIRFDLRHPNRRSGRDRRKPATETAIG